MTETSHKKRRLEDIVKIEARSIIDSVGFRSATGLKAINVTALNEDIKKSLARLTEWILHELRRVERQHFNAHSAASGESETVVRDEGRTMNDGQRDRRHHGGEDDPGDSQPEK